MGFQTGKWVVLFQFGKLPFLRPRKAGKRLPSSAMARPVLPARHSPILGCGSKSLSSSRDSRVFVRTLFWAHEFVLTCLETSDSLS